MAAVSAPAMEPATLNGGLPGLTKLDIPQDEPSPGSDSQGDEEALYRDQEDAQSFIQPAISPEAIRLTSPKTPAAEKAAALEQIPGGGLFDQIDRISFPSNPKLLSEALSTGPTSPRKLTKSPIRQDRSAAEEAQGQSQGRDLPTPWQTGPKEMVVIKDGTTRPAMAGVFEPTRQRRSSSGGNETLKRLREAFPSLSISNNFLSNFAQNSFLSNSTNSKGQTPVSRLRTTSDGSIEPRQMQTLPPHRDEAVSAEASSNPSGQLPVLIATRRSGAGQRPSSITSTHSRKTLRRSTSDESMLYHTLSRMSSFHDERWQDVPRQVNSRLKAIKDSWDGPTFKFSQLPSILPSPIKKSFHQHFDTNGTPPEISEQDAAPGAAQNVKDANGADWEQTLESLTGDIVIMGGYRGSVLRSTATNRQLWIPMKVGLNMRKVDLEMGLDPEDEERSEETIYSSGMLQHIGPVDVSRRLFKRLRECANAKSGKLRIWDYGYDWRLSPHLLSRKLVSFLEKLPSNDGTDPLGNRGALVIPHSLGGIITRHAVNQRPELFSGVIFAGTPQRCINILGPFRNGDAVLLNEKVLTAQVNFSIRTTFVFLPEDGFCFVNRHTGEQYPVDFYNPQHWAQYSLSPCIEPALGPYNTRPSALGSLLNLSGSFTNLPSRVRGNSTASETRPPTSPTRNTGADAVRRAEVAHDHTLAPQMGTVPGASQSAQQHQAKPDNGTRARYMEYLTRTLAEVKQFRAELAHNPSHTEENRYPPLAVIYGKDTPTVYAAHVSCREAIGCSDAYDNLLFQSGDGVVLAREALPPQGYELVKGGLVDTDRGHITMLGDFPAVGKAIEAVTRGRKKGIGLGGPVRGSQPSQEATVTTP